MIKQNVTYSLLCAAIQEKYAGSVLKTLREDSFFTYFPIEKTIVTQKIDTTLL